MRRREHPIAESATNEQPTGTEGEIEKVNGRRPLSGHGKKSKPLFVFIAVLIASFIASFRIQNSKLFIFNDGLNPPQQQAVIADQSVWDAREFLRDPQHEPVYGITSGAYRRMHPSILPKVIINCGVNLRAHESPPEELLVPGRLHLRPELSEQSLCFLWYSASFWTRPTGGEQGLELLRKGNDVDNKVHLAKWVSDYNAKHRCPSHQILPPTLDLRNAVACAAFVYNNSQWARAPASLWFLKDPQGSTGRHIRLLRRADVERAAAALPKPAYNASSPANASVAHPVCNGSVAQLGIEDPLIADGRKFDHRMFVLLASVEFNLTAPLKPNNPKWAYGPKGSRVSVEAVADSDLSMHITNPRFGLEHANSTEELLRPSAELVQTLPRAEREAVLRRQVRAMLQVVFAVHHRFRKPKKFKLFGHAWLAADVVYDKSFNPFIVDVNTGPNFYHSEPEWEWPEWFIDERSALIRAAADIVQQVAFRKRARVMSKNIQIATAGGTQNASQNSTHPLAEAGFGGWTLVYEEEKHQTHRDQGQRGPFALVPGECALKGSA